MSRVALDLGIVQIYWYSICILLGMAVGMYVVYREARNKNIHESLITNLIFYTIIIAIIGARLYYVIFDFGYYSKNPIEALEIWNGGLAIHGAIILGGLFVINYAKQHKMDILKLLDICSAGVIIGQAIGRWGNFFNQEVYGREVSLEFLQGLHLPSFIIDGMHIGGSYYQPLFLYESIWCIIGFIVILIVRRRKYIKTGQIFGIYCMWYSVGRFFLEGMRDEKYNLMLGGLKAAQVVSIGMFVVGLFFFVRRFKTSRFEHLYNDAEIRTETTDNNQMTQSFFKKKENKKEKSTKMNISAGTSSNQITNNVPPALSPKPEPEKKFLIDNAPTINEAPTSNNQSSPIFNQNMNNTMPNNEPVSAELPVINNQQFDQQPQSQQPIINTNLNNSFDNTNNNQNNTNNNTFL